MTKPKHKTTIKIIIGISAVILLFLLSLVIYQVDSSEYAIVTQFGNPVRVVENPGLQLKFPDPIESVQRLDKRVQVYQTTSIELLTLDKKSISLDYYGTWKVSDPVTYLKTVKDKVGAESRLLDVFSSSLGVQLGQYNLDQLVKTYEEELELKTIMNEATE